MTKICRVFNLSLMAVWLATGGCCCFQKSDSKALQGRWKGEETGAHPQGPCYLTIKGQSLDYHGANTNEWYKGVLTLYQNSTPPRADVLINDCPMVQYIGKTSHGIYRLERGVLTITANEPGNPNTPMTFDAANSRHFVFTKKSDSN